MSTSKKTILFVGGGIAGHQAAKLLATKLASSKTLNASEYEIVLLTNKPFFIIPFAGLRMIVDAKAKAEDTALVEYDMLFKDVKVKASVKIGKAVSIDPTSKTVALESGESLAYAALVLAPGSIWEGPLDFPESKEQIKDHLNTVRTSIKDANSIAIVGGGAVGIELAGEIKDLYPKKKVTLVQGSNLLLSAAYPDKYRTYAESNLTQRGVEIVHDEYVDEIPAPGSASTFVTRSGKTLPGDLVIQARGPKPRSEFIKSLAPNVLNEKGYVKVKPTLQVQGFEDVFAMGDVIDWNEQKQGAKMGNHAAAVVENVLSVLGGAPAAKQYSTGPELIIITNGIKGGTSYFGFLWGIILGNWVTALLKSKTLFVGPMRKSFGYAS